MVPMTSLSVTQPSSTGGEESSNHVSGVRLLQSTTATNVASSTLLTGAKLPNGVTDVGTKALALTFDGKRQSMSHKPLQCAHEDKGYLSKRKLRRHVTTLELWGFCVGVVICGEYTGWQGGLPSGWINLVVSTVLSIIIYAGALWSEVDMSTALPFSSAHTAFTHAAFGPAVGAMNGFIVMLSFAQQAATNVALISRYVKRIFDWPNASSYALWIFFYVVMIYVNLNSKRFFRSTLVINTYCCLALFVYMFWAWSTMSEQADWSWLSPAGANQFTAELSLVKVIDSLPYAIWWFVGIEAFPVVAEELKSVEGSTSRAVNWGMSTLFFYSVTLVWIAPVLPPFSPALATTDYPVGLSILQGLFRIDPVNDPVVFDMARRTLFLLLLLWAQGVTPTANLYSTSRYMYGLSRGGLLPTSLSLTNESFSQVMTSLFMPTRTPSPSGRAKKGIGTRRPLPNQSGNNRVSFGVESEASPGSDTLSGSGIVVNRRTNVSAAPRSDRTLNASAILGFSYTSSTPCDRTPVRAVLASAVLAYSFNWIIEIMAILQSISQSGSSDHNAAFDQVVDLLLRVAVWFACISHAVQLASYIRIRLAIKSLDRPSPSPAGLGGAIFAFLVVVLFGIVGPFVLTTSVYWVSAALFVMMLAAFLVYFNRYARPRLKNSPERLFIRSILKQRQSSAEVLTGHGGVAQAATTAEMGFVSTTLPATTTVMAEMINASPTSGERSSQALAPSEATGRVAGDVAAGDCEGPVVANLPPKAPISTDTA